jgi:hypothetical protein
MDGACGEGWKWMAGAIDAGEPDAHIKGKHVVFFWLPCSSIRLRIASKTFRPVTLRLIISVLSDD